MGSVFLRSLDKIKQNILVVDFDPEIIETLKDRKIDCIYGDISSPEILDRLPIQEARIVISTIPKREESMLVLQKVKSLNKDIFVIVTAEQVNEALDLYKVGADYVVLPKFISGEKSLNLIKLGLEKNKEKILKTRRMHINYLKNLREFF